MPYIYVIRHSKRAGYYLKNVQCSLCHSGVDALKALKTLYVKDSFSPNCNLMIDEMYLQKSAQYQSGEYVGVDEEGNSFKGIVAFMVVGLKQSITFVVQAISEVTFNGQWLAEKISDNIDNLI